MSEEEPGVPSGPPPPPRELIYLSRATLVSIVATGLEFLILPAAVQWVEKWVAFASVQLLANLVTFIFYKYWAFDAAKRGSVTRQYAKQTVVFGGSWLLNTGIPSLLSYRMGMSPILAFAISNVFVYLGWNYPLNRYWVFEKDEPAAE